jgi:DNA repair protein RadD
MQSSTKKTPRYYQAECVEAIIQGWKDKEVPYASCAPGSGKSLILAMLSERCLAKSKRVLQLVPRDKLLMQNHDEMKAWTDYRDKIGIVCAGLGRKEIHKDCVIATPESFKSYRRAQHFDMVLIDECHNVSNKPMSMYRSIIRSLKRINPRLVIAGVSGTTYREGQGMLEKNNIDGEALFTKLVYETPIKQMIAEGYLCHIQSINCEGIETSDLKTKGKDYDVDQMNVKFDAIAENAVKDIKEKFDEYNIKTAILFCSSIANATHIVGLFNSPDVRLIHGGFSRGERDAITSWLEAGQGRRIIVAVGMLTEGYDFPALQAVVLLRATKSLRLYVQMVTRAIRANDGKECGYILDYGQNIDRHGSIDETIPPKTRKKKGEPPVRQCLACNFMNPAHLKKCKQCESEFVINSQDGNYGMRTKAQILADKLKSKIKEYPVTCEPLFLTAYKDEKRMIKMLIQGVPFEKYICLEHKGYAKQQGEQFIINMLKNKDDFITLKQSGNFTVDKMIYLLNNKYTDFFRPIKAVLVESKFNGAIIYAD